jgi:hypothetical protein
MQSNSKVSGVPTDSQVRILGMRESSFHSSKVGLRHLTTFEDFSKTRQNFDLIPTTHVSYASSYFALLQCNLVKHPIVDIWEDLDTLRFLQDGEYPPQVTSSHRDCIQ